jgi:hypothetical protein
MCCKRSPSVYSVTLCSSKASMSKEGRTGDQRSLQATDVPLTILNKRRTVLVRILIDQLSDTWFNFPSVLRMAGSCRILWDNELANISKDNSM